MTLSIEEAAYRDATKLKRLTFDGVNDLYQTRHGAHTIKDAIELDEVQRKYLVRMNARIAASRPEIAYSAALGIRDEDCIERHGCSSFGG